MFARQAEQLGLGHGFYANAPLVGILCGVVG